MNQPGITIDDFFNLERLEGGGRDSFWKAAILAMENGAANWLSKDMEELSEARNLSFKEELVYQSRLADWLAGGLNFKGQPWDKQPFSTDDALHLSGCRDRSAIEKRHKDAAAEALRSLGFKHKQIRHGKFQPWKWI